MGNHHYPILYVWAALTAVLCLVPLLHVHGRRTAATVQERLGRLRRQPAGQRLVHVREAQDALTKPQLGTLLESQASRGAQTGPRPEDLAERASPVQRTAALQAEVFGTPMAAGTVAA